MIAAVAENNAWEKTMICFGIYLMISKVQITPLDYIIMGRKTFESFPKPLQIELTLS
jgi:dihydrofolate reductase